MTTLRYAGVHLCAPHFRRLLESRVKQEIRRQVDLGRVGRVGVAVSGGKDSTTCAAILADVLSPRRHPELVAIAVDEGIPGYRDRALDVCRTAMGSLGVPLHVTSHRAVVGATTDEAARADPATPPCTYCGPWRRAALNGAAATLGCDVLATGHNLDDMAQSVLMDLLRGDLGRLARLAPHHEHDAVDGLVRRIVPLRTTPEREVALYAHLRGLPVSYEECPHAARAARGRYRDLLLGLVEHEPSLRHTLLATADRLKPMLQSGPDGEDPSACVRCGSPAASVTHAGAGPGPMCQACLLAAHIRGLLGRGPPTPSTR